MTTTIEVVAKKASDLIKSGMKAPLAAFNACRGTEFTVHQVTSELAKHSAKHRRAKHVPKQTNITPTRRWGGHTQEQIEAYQARDINYQ